ncbi:hypothetical protein NMY22_g2264 [Coprinellus aureogranulatus]|nr:hypothetical protein NMY22_g2264 [Coprinellus aureogranulatus]
MCTKLCWTFSPGVVRCLYLPLARVIRTDRIPSTSQLRFEITFSFTDADGSLSRLVFTARHPTLGIRIRYFRHPELPKPASTRVGHEDMTNLAAACRNYASKV